MRKALAALALAIGAALGACSTERVPPSTEISTSAPPEPRLGAGDRVRVIVFGETTISGEYPVGTGGVISLPLVGPLNVAGKSVEEVQKGIADVLSPGYLLHPRVTVNVLSYRPFFILGEVVRPGQYPTMGTMSVTQTVATAGGYTYRANKRIAYIRRSDSDSEMAFEIRSDKPVWVLPGDTVRIGERYF